MKMATAILLGAILIVAAALRFTALDFGEGRILVRPDEDAVPLALKGMDDGVLMPPLVLYGGGFFYPLRAFTSLWESARLPVPSGDGLLPGAARVRIARWWSAVLSVLTVALTFAMGRRIRGTETAVIASLIVATSTLAVREAHFGKADTAAAFASLVFLLAATDSVVRARLRPLLVGAALGFAVSNKASVGLLAPAAYVFLRGYETKPWRPPWRALGLGASAAIATFLVLNPFWILQHEQADPLARTLFSAVTTKEWLVGAEQALPPTRYYSEITLRYGTGWAVTWATIPVLAYGLFRSPATRVLSLAVLAPFAIFTTSPMVMSRFLLPLLPPLAVLVGVAVSDLLQWLPARARAIGLLALALLFTAEPLARSAELVRLLGERDTRLLASEWLAEHVPADAVIVSWGTPDSVNTDWGGVPPGGRTLRRNLDPNRWAEEGISHVVWHSYPLAYSSVPPPPELEQRTPVAIFESFTNATRNPVLEPMDAFYLPLARFEGIIRPGPRIAIYDVRGWVPRSD